MSVRKRVIKILRDICVMQPDFPKISDICVRILRRISDEEAIRVWHSNTVLSYLETVKDLEVNTSISIFVG